MEDEELLQGSSPVEQDPMLQGPVEDNPFLEQYTRKGSLTGGVSNDKMSEYSRLNVPVVEDLKGSWDKILGENQSFGEQSLNAVGQVLAKVPATVIQNFATLADLDAVYKPDTDYVNNSLYNLMEEYKNSVDESIPIYQTNPGESFDFGDSGWWLKGISNTAESAAAFVISSYMVGGGVGKLLTGLYRGGRYATAALKGKDALTAARFGAILSEGASTGIKATGTLLTSIASNHMEGFGVALQTAKTAKDMALNEGKSEAEANRIASESAAISYNINRLNIALNLSSTGAFLTAPRHTRQMLKEMTWKSTLKEMGVEAGQESLEESINNIAEKRGLAHAKGNKYGSDELLNDMFSKEGLESAFWGAIGGAGQTALTGVSQRLPLQRGSDGSRQSAVSLNNERYYQQQELVEKYNMIAKANGVSDLTSAFRNTKDMVDLMGKLEENVNNKEEFERLQNQLVDFQAFTAFEFGTTEKLINLYQELGKGEAKEGMDNDVQSDNYYKKRANEAVDRIKKLEDKYVENSSFLNSKDAFIKSIEVDEQKQTVKKTEEGLIKAKAELLSTVQKTQQEHLDKVNQAVLQTIYNKDEVERSSLSSFWYDEKNNVRIPLVLDPTTMRMQKVEGVPSKVEEKFNESLDELDEYGAYHQTKLELENAKLSLESLKKEYDEMTSDVFQQKLKKQRDDLFKTIKEIEKNKKDKKAKEGKKKDFKRTIDTLKSKVSPKEKKKDDSEVVNEPFDFSGFVESDTVDDTSDNTGDNTDEEGAVFVDIMIASENGEKEFFFNGKNHPITNNDEVQALLKLVEDYYTNKDFDKGTGTTVDEDLAIKQHDLQTLADAAEFTEFNPTQTETVSIVKDIEVELNSQMIGVDQVHTGSNLDGATSLAYLAKSYEVISSNGGMVKKDIDNQVHVETELLKLKVGDEVVLEVLDDDTITVRDEHVITGDKGEFITWGEYKRKYVIGKNPTLYNEKVPIGVFVNGSSNPIAFIHEKNWINKNNVSEKVKSITEQKAQLAKIRESVIESPKSVKISSVSNGVFIKTKDGSFNNISVLGDVEIGVVKKGVIAVNITGKKNMVVSNAKSLKEEGMVVVKIPTKNGHVGVPVRRKPLNEEYVGSIMRIVELWLKIQQGVVLTSDETKQVEELKNYELDLTNKFNKSDEGIEAYINKFVYATQLGENANEELVSKVVGIPNKNVKVMGFGAGSVIYMATSGTTNKKDVKYINPKNYDERLLETLEKHLKGMLFNVNLKYMGQTLNIPLLKEDGTIEPIIGTYDNMIRQNLETNLLSFEQGGDRYHTVQNVIRIDDSQLLLSKGSYKVKPLSKLELEKKTEEIKKNKDYVELTSDQKNYKNSKTNTVYKRVTSTIKKESKANDLSKTALAIGTDVDTIVRKFFEEDSINPKDYANLNEKVVADLLVALEPLKSYFEERGEKVIPNDIVLYDEAQKVAGTIDLMTISDDGFIRIYDIKTMRGDKFTEFYKGETQTKYNTTTYGKSLAQQYQEQLSLYNILLNNTHGVEAVQSFIIPIVVDYKENSKATSVSLKETMATPLLNEVTGIDGTVYTKNVSTTSTQQTVEVTNEQLLKTLPTNKDDNNTGKVNIIVDQHGNTETRYIPFSIIEEANKNDKLGGQTAKQINDRGGYSDRELDHLLTGWRTMVSKPTQSQTSTQQQSVQSRQVSPQHGTQVVEAKRAEIEAKKDELERKYGKRFINVETYYLVRGSDNAYYINHGDRGKSIKSYKFQTEEQAKKYAEKENIELLTIAQGGVGFTSENKAKYDAELKELNVNTEEQTPTQVVEELKADIEKRRQEELKEYPIAALLVKELVNDGDNKLLEGEDADYQNQRIERTIASGVKNGLTREQIFGQLNANGHVFNLGNDSVAINNFIQNRIDGKENRTFAEFKNNPNDKINAKYDAEYVEAVKRGEITKEQAIQALEEVGRKDSKAYAELTALDTQQPTTQADASTDEEIPPVGTSTKIDQQVEQQSTTQTSTQAQTVTQTPSVVESSFSNLGDVLSLSISENGKTSTVKVSAKGVEGNSSIYEKLDDKLKEAIDKWKSTHVGKWQDKRTKEGRVNKEAEEAVKKLLFHKQEVKQEPIITEEEFRKVWNKNDTGEELSKKEQSVYNKLTTDLKKKFEDEKEKLEEERKNLEFKKNLEKKTIPVQTEVVKNTNDISNTIDDDDDYDMGSADYLPSADEVFDHIDDVLKDMFLIKGFNQVQHNAIVEFMVYAINQDVIASKGKVSKKDIVDKWEKYFTDLFMSSYTKGHKNRATVMRKILEAWPDVLRFTEQELRRLKTINVDGNVTMEYIASAGSDLEKNKYDDDATLSMDSKKSVSHKLKLRLSSVRELVSDGNGGFKQATMWASLPKIVPYDIVFNTVTKELAGSKPDFKKQMEILTASSARIPFLREVVDVMNAAESDAQAEFSSLMAKHEIRMLQVKWTVNDEGAFNAMVVESNSNAAGKAIQQTWNNNVQNFLFEPNEDGSEYVAKLDLIKPILERYKEQFGELTLKHNRVEITDDNKSHYAALAKAFLDEIGIIISDKAWESVLNNGLFYGKSTVQFEDMFRRGGLFNNLKESLENIVNGTKFDNTDLVSNSSTKALAVLESSYNPNVIANSFMNGENKMIFSYTMNKYLVNRAKRLLTDKNLLENLSRISYSSENYLLKEFLESEEGSVSVHAQTFNVDYFDSTKEGERRGITADQMSDEMLELTRLSLFANRGNWVTQNIHRKATMMYLTTSDKKTPFLIDMVAHLSKVIVSGEGKISLGINTKQLLYETVVLPEINRILDYQKNKGKYNIKDYEDGAGLFLAMPSLNVLEVDGMYEENGDLAQDVLTKPAVVDAIKEHLEKFIERQIQEKLQEWDELGITELKNGERNILKIDSSYATIFGSDATKIAGDYIINTMIANSTFHQLIVGDPAIFFKKGKGVIKKDGKFIRKAETKEEFQNLLEAYKDTSRATFINIGKRLAGDIAPGVELSLEEDDPTTYKQLFMEDSYNVSKTFEYNATLLDKPLTKEDHEELVKARNGDENAIKTLSKKFPKAAPYLNIEASNAQEYTTLKEHLFVMKTLGKIKKEVYKNYLKRIEEEGDDLFLTDDELEELVFQPMKPVYVNNMVEYVNDAPAVDVRMYIKTSSFPLLPQFTKGLEMDKLRKLMEDEGYDRAVYLSGAKVGSPKKSAKIWNGDGTINIDENSDFSESVKVLDRDYFRIQQEVPFKKEKGVNNDGTQKRALLFANLLETDGFVYNGQTYKGKELQKIFEQKYGELYKDSMELFEEEFYTKFDKESREKMQTLKSRKLSTKEEDIEEYIDQMIGKEILEDCSDSGSGSKYKKKKK